MQLIQGYKDVNRSVIDSMVLKSISHPHFMLYCPDKFRRADYIKNFFKYYLKKYVKSGFIYTSDSSDAVAIVLPVNEYCKKVTGSFKMSLKVSKLEKRFIQHKMTVGGITEILVPMGIDARILNIFGNSGCDSAIMMKLVNEITAKAKEENFAVIYETLSRRLVLIMESMGFEIAYQKQYLGTQYVQTVMTYNINREIEINKDETEKLLINN